MRESRITDTRRADLGPGFAARRAVNDVRWGAVTSGTFVGLGFMTLLSSLWVAWGYASGWGIFSDNIRWWLAGTGIASFFVAGLVAGYVSGVRGAVAGFFNSATVWGLVSTVGLATALGIGLATLNLNSASFTNLHDQVGSGPLWAAFAAIAIGLAACLLGGLLGGSMIRRVTYPALERQGEEAYPDDRTAVVERHDHVMATGYDDGPGYGDEGYDRTGSGYAAGDLEPGRHRR